MAFPTELIRYLEPQPDALIVMGADYRILAANATYRRQFAGGRDIDSVVFAHHGIQPPAAPAERRSGYCIFIIRRAARSMSTSN